MAGKLIHILKGFLNLLFPQKCLKCGSPHVIICDKCLNTLPYPEDGLRVSKSVFKNVFAATSYKDETVKKVIWLFKYKGAKTLAEPLAGLIYRRLKIHMDSCVIIPIPVYKKRLKERGYNQAELLAHFLSDKMSVRFLPDVLYKIKETVSQVKIKDRDERLRNVKGVFEVKNLRAVKNKTVILVDDITTTGATLAEAGRVLKQAGAKEIIGVVVAKG